MPGQALIAIGDLQWQVDIASTEAERALGLGDIPAIPPATGVLFDTGREDRIDVTTITMLFPLDIAFLSDALVVTEVYRNVEPYSFFTSALPARFWLEVNSGELELVNPGDELIILEIAGVAWAAPAAGAIETVVPALAMLMLLGMMTPMFKGAAAEPGSYFTDTAEQIKRSSWYCSTKGCVNLDGAFQSAIARARRGIW